MDNFELFCDEKDTQTPAVTELLPLVEVKIDPNNSEDQSLDFWALRKIHITTLWHFTLPTTALNSDCY